MPRFHAEGQASEPGAAFIASMVTPECGHDTN